MILLALQKVIISGCSRAGVLRTEMTNVSRNGPASQQSDSTTGRPMLKRRSLDVLP